MASSIPDGARVMLKSLLKTELNGAEGSCLGIDLSTGRYKIQLVDTALYQKSILIKYENLEIIDGGANNHQNSSWSQGLSKLAAYEWFIDCYRMRLDDDYVWGGGNLHGLYNSDTTEETIVADFLTFCKLAMCNNALPLCWDWLFFLEKHGNLLCFAFEKSDAKEKYGKENIFLAAMGGRSLRFTAEIIYGCSMEAQEESETHQKVLAILDPLIFSEKGLKFAIQKNPHLFHDVGGISVWLKLLRDVRIQKSRTG